MQVSTDQRAQCHVRIQPCLLLGFLDHVVDSFNTFVHPNQLYKHGDTHTHTHTSLCNQAFLMQSRNIYDKHKPPKIPCIYAFLLLPSG